MTSAYKAAAIERLGSVAAAALVVNAVAEAVGVAWSAVYIVMLMNFDRLPLRTVELWETAGYVGFVQVGVFWIVAVIVGRWIYRASANTHASIRRLETSPAWAVGWYFIPFANLWKPFEAMSGIVRANLPSGTAQPPMTMWWTLWLTASISGGIAGNIVKRASSLEMLMVGNGLTIVSGLAGLGAALCMRQIVQKVTDGQSIRKSIEVF